MYDHPAPRRIPQVRKIHASRREAPGRADPAGVEPARDQRPDRERERDREQDVARVEHRRVDRHRGMAEQRVQPHALRGHRVEPRERVGSAGDEHQTGEEDPEAAEHGGRPRHDLPMLVAGGEQNAARCQREHPGPEQERAALAAPHRGHLVERGRRGRGVVGDQLDREVVAQEGGFEHDHADGEQDRRRVHGPARGIHPAPVARETAVERGTGAVEKRDQPADEAGDAELDQAAFGS